MPPSRLPATAQDRSAQNEREHLLLLMTWLLPLAAPVLAVWVRTLFTAGLTTPFDGDHNVLYVAPFLVLVDPSWGLTWTWAWGGPPAGLKPRWTMLVLAVAAFVALFAFDVPFPAVILAAAAAGWIGARFAPGRLNRPGRPRRVSEMNARHASHTRAHTRLLRLHGSVLLVAGRMHVPAARLPLSLR